MEAYDFVGRVQRMLADAPKGEKRRKKYKCLLCKDDGVIEYVKSFGGLEYRYFAHCTCEKGGEFKYDGSKCKEKSDYRMASIEEILTAEAIAEIRAENESGWNNR
jgi:hypothetical protein